MPGLEEFSSALCSGLFFTLSIGAGLTLFTTAAVWVWDRLFFRNKHVKAFLILAWVGLILLINIPAISFWGTLYCFLIPLIVFTTTAKLLPKPGQHQNNLRVLAHLLPIIVLAILWMTQYDRHLFIDLRDHLLFSNPVGKNVSDFYYKYTSYATEAFKSLNQKTLKTCRLPQLPDQKQSQSLQTVLLALDYLPVDTEAPVDLEIVSEDDHLLMKHDGRVIVETTVKDLLSGPKQILDQFSLGTDRYSAFRPLTFFALLLGYPLTLYTLFHGLFWLLIRIFANRQTAATIASVICLIIGLVIFGAFSSSRSWAIEKNQLAETLNSADWQERVAALRFIAANKLEIGRYKGYIKSLSSPKVAERYWLAQAMAKSKTAETYDALISLLNDANINVESMAYRALARRGDKRAIPKILRAVNASDRWYSQLYAYNALRTLGWKQNRSH
jgi:glucan phosphoethanolaminetransferase (alkaline phosphatase superfamily)